MLLLVLGSLATLTFLPALSGHITQVPPEDLDKLILYILEILKIVLGYLVGRGLRLIFQT